MRSKSKRRLNVKKRKKYAENRKKRKMQLNLRKHSRLKERNVRTLLQILCHQSLKKVTLT